jgi:hypothetical protein
VNAETRLPDGPGTAADPRSSAWAVAALPGPRTFREAPPPREEERVEVAVADEVTIADAPLPVEEQPTVDFPGPEPRFEPAADPVEPAGEDEAPVQFQLDTGVTPSADWDDDPASYSAPI